MDAVFGRDVAAEDPGAAVSIYHAGRLSLSRVYGMADLEQGTRVLPHTRFHVASVSKQFTAFAIALLAREGRLDLDADIRGYLAYVPDFGHPITVRHLLHHTSGLRDQWSLFQLGGHGMDDRLGSGQIVNLVSRQAELNFTPGTRYMYSNTGYTLLGEIVREVSGQSLREFTRDRIFEPLAMDHTFFLDDVDEIVPHRANSYSGDGNAAGWRRAILSYDNVGATGLLSTAEDLAKWAGNLTRPVVGDRALIEQISRNGRLDDGREVKYGFGLIRTTLGGHSVLRHDGADAGFRALFVYYTDHDFAISITSNAPRDLAAKAAEIAGLYLPAPLAPADGTPPLSDGPDPTPFAGAYLNPEAQLLRLHAGDGRLYYGGGAEDRDPAIFRSDGSFDLGFPDYLSFRPVYGRAGQVIAIEQHTPQGGEVVLYERVTDKQAVDDEVLRRYLGDYRSQELDATYTVAMDHGGLVLRSLWATRDVVLRPVADDRFDASDMQIGTVIFERDGGSSIVRLIVLGGRARNVRFERVPPR